MEEIKNFLYIFLLNLKRTFNDKICIMQCTLCYPTQPKDANLSAIQEIKKALHSHPGNRGLSIKLAQMYYSSGKLDKSLELLLPFQALSTRKSNVYYYIKSN